jgi:hypothetical protein
LTVHPEADANLGFLALGSQDEVDQEGQAVQVELEEPVLESSATRAEIVFPTHESILPSSTSVFIWDVHDGEGTLTQAREVELPIVLSDTGDVLVLGGPDERTLGGPAEPQRAELFVAGKRD